MMIRGNSERTSLLRNFVNQLMNLFLKAPYQQCRAQRDPELSAMRAHLYDVGFLLL